MILDTLFYIHCCVHCCLAFDSHFLYHMVTSPDLPYAKRPGLGQACFVVASLLPCCCLVVGELAILRCCLNLSLPRNQSANAPPVAPIFPRLTPDAISCRQAFNQFSVLLGSRNVGPLSCLLTFASIYSWLPAQLSSWQCSKRGGFGSRYTCVPSATSTQALWRLGKVLCRVTTYPLPRGRQSGH